jgi:3-methyladenine DNA glycosylase AlkD
VSLATRARDALVQLERKGTKKTRDGYPRYGIVATKALGVSIADIKRIAKGLGQDHDLAEALWQSGWYEARLLACFVDDPARVTPAQMDRWCRDFDNWGICDTACFVLFDKTPHAYAKVAAWAKRKPEYERRAAFALLASLAGHDKKAPDSRFVALLPLIGKAAGDERNFMKKGVSWALRGIGHRNPALHATCVELAQRLAKSENATERWLGKDTLRDLTRPLVVTRMAARARPPAR